MQIEALEIDDSIAAKLRSKHGVTWDEVQAACFGPGFHVRRGREGTYLVYGQSAAGRYLLVVLVADATEQGTWRVVTARDMTGTERRRFRER